MRRKDDNVVNVFDEVLLDSENSFATALEERALKKSANTHVFEYIKDEFEKKLNERGIVGAEPKYRKRVRGGNYTVG